MFDMKESIDFAEIITADRLILCGGLFAARPLAAHDLSGSKRPGRRAAPPEQYALFTHP